MSRFLKVAFGIWLLALLAGCKTPRPYYDPRNIKVGMSKDYVLQTLGEPSRDVLMPDGTEQVIWHYKAEGFEYGYASFLFRSNVVIQVPGKAKEVTTEDKLDLRRKNQIEEFNKAVQTGTRVSTTPEELEASEKLQARLRYNESHPELSEQIRIAIATGRLVGGMTGEQVTITCGEPQKKEVKETVFGRQEQWSYADGRSLAFENGTLRSFNW